MADSDVVRVELVGSVRRQSAIWHGTFRLQLLLFVIESIPACCSVLFICWLVLSDMFRTDLIAHLQGTGIDSL